MTKYLWDAEINSFQQNNMSIILTYW